MNSFEERKKKSNVENDLCNMQLLWMVASKVWFGGLMMDKDNSTNTNPPFKQKCFG